MKLDEMGVLVPSTTWPSFPNLPKQRRPVMSSTCLTWL